MKKMIHPLLFSLGVLAISPQAQAMPAPSAPPAENVPPIVLTIKNFAGQTKQIDGKKNWTVGELKDVISQEASELFSESTIPLSVSNMLLVYKYKRIDGNTDQLLSYGIDNGSIIFVLLRKRGLDTMNGLADALPETHHPGPMRPMDELAPAQRFNPLSYTPPHGNFIPHLNLADYLPKKSH